MISICDGLLVVAVIMMSQEKYISEVGQGDKEFGLLINKADYLSPELLAHWSQYFNDKGIQHIFFSALKEQDKIDSHEIEEVDEEEDDNDSSSDDDGGGENEDAEDGAKKAAT